MSDARRLCLELRPSRVLAVWIVSAHVVAGACLLGVWPGLPGGAAALLLCALGMAVAWRVALLRGPASVRGLELLQMGKGSASLAGGARLQLSASVPRHVTRFWVVVPAGPPARRLLITAGMLGPDQFRRLRVWALWGGIARPALESPLPGRPAPTAELI